MKQANRIRTLFSLIVITLLFFLSVAPLAIAAPSRWIRSSETSDNVIALTIDDGSDGANYAEILRILDKHNVKATFFLTGSGAQNHPARIRDTVNKGHDIGNHSYNHPNFTEISTTEMKAQLDRTETIVKNLTGKSTKPYFRAPYGSTNSTVLNTVGNAGYTHTFHWSIDTLDWTGNSANTIYNRVMTNLHPGAIVLAHTGRGASGTPAALDRLIPAIKSRGYRFVTLSELMGRKTTLPVTGGTSYTVRSGDTLYAIARRYNTTVARLASWNNISNVNLIRVGQVLKVSETTTPTTPAPPSMTPVYTVRAGDTLYGIARRYNTTVARLVALNLIPNANLIRVGQRLRLTDTTTTPAPSPSVRTYTVRSGDTLYAIARRYGTTVSRLASINSISNINLIRVGQVIRLP